MNADAVVGVMVVLVGVDGDIIGCVGLLDVEVIAILISSIVFDTEALIRSSPPIISLLSISFDVNGVFVLPFFCICNDSLEVVGE